MNERIRELADEAGYYLYDLTETHECKTVETDSTDEWVTLEKFAQLIVKECAGLFPNVYVEIETDHGHTPVIAADYIKKHFGVEK
jgi:protein-L-isoaspartate O-methyltransferase